MKLDCGYRVDALVADTVIVEAKSVEVIHPVHRAQTLTYLKLGGWKIALLLNFNVAILKDGIERVVLDFKNIENAEPKGSTRPFVVSPNTARFVPCVMATYLEPVEFLAREVVDAALEVHRQLGPGLLPSAYEACLCHEFSLRGMPFQRRCPLPLSYKGTDLAMSDEVTLLIDDRIVVRPHAVLAIQPVHEAELLSQLRIGGWNLGLLLNFNNVVLKDDIRRIINTAAIRRV
jgi:GxxExxY protein